MGDKDDTQSQIERRWMVCQSSQPSWDQDIRLLPLVSICLLDRVAEESARKLQPLPVSRSPQRPNRAKAMCSLTQRSTKN